MNSRARNPVIGPKASRRSALRKLAVRSACALALALGTQVHAQALAFDVDGGELKAALDAYIAQSGVQLIYKIEDVRGLSTKGVKGSMPPNAALMRLLEGTRLRLRRGADGAMAIVATPPGAAQEPVQSLGEVVISATRRREPSREVPMQVNAIAADQLERSGARTLGDYVAQEAGIDLRSGGAAGSGQISMRGVTTGVQQISTVGVYVDEVATGSSSAYASGASTQLDMGLLDLHHIEILRGPQGTLYGAGAMGGLLKYVTNQPDASAFSGSVTLAGSGTQDGGPNGTVSSVLNLPLKQDVAALRLAAFRDHFGGSFDASGPAARRHMDRGDTTGFRASLLLTPDPDLAIRLTATQQDTRRDGIGSVWLDPLDTRTLGLGERTRSISLREPMHHKIGLYSLDVEYDLGWARFNAISSHQRMDLNRRGDNTDSLAPALNAMGMPVGNVPLDQTVRQRKFTQELRLTSRPNQDLEWLAGLFYTREEGLNVAHIDANLLGGGALELLDVNMPSVYKEAALYGDATWHLTPALALTAGARLAHNSQTFGTRASGLLSGAGTSFSADSSETSKTYLLTARYALTPLSSVYLRTASGYQPGGPNAFAPSPAAANIPKTFASSSLWSYELGYKADSADKTFSMQASLYDIEWKKLQQLVDFDGFSVLVNSGAARIRGAELGATWQPTPAWRLATSLSAIDARLSEDAPKLEARAGTRLPNSARFAATLSLQHRFRVGERDAYAGVAARYVGARNSGLAGSTVLPNFRMPAYTNIDLEAGIKLGSANLGFFVRNLTNRRQILSADYSLAMHRVGAALGMPRTIGASLNFSF